MPSRFKWKTSTLFWATAVVAAFFAGRTATMESVLIATRDLPRRHIVQDGDFRLEYRLSRNIPASAVRTLAYADGKSLSVPIQNSEMVLAANFSDRTMYSFAFPPGYKVVNVRIRPNTDPLIMHLLMRGDGVGLSANVDGAETVLETSPIQIFHSVPDSDIVGLLVDQETAETISRVRKTGESFRLVNP
ncbi:CpaB family protein [Mariniblastus fucicola]|uniref:SAF domain-containing protein n=1 Tax=Mariniblastus fucicola TaxID=980251 RepID=A0A5B9PBU9_9BACT|nr:hypothetical protein [Mariniblastus fucicola]QEG21976.1 hypothetical protein MFFC18_18370 [Mariniblastus fucicola]